MILLLEYLPLAQGGQRTRYGPGKWGTQTVQTQRTNEFFSDVGELTFAAAEGASQGAQVYFDRIIPFADPFADLGFYDPLDPTLQASQFLGAMGQEAAFGA